jgi:hypothetical protein
MKTLSIKSQRLAIVVRSILQGLPFSQQLPHQHVIWKALGLP